MLLLKKPADRATSDVGRRRSRLDKDHVVSDQQQFVSSASQVTQLLASPATSRDRKKATIVTGSADNDETPRWQVLILRCCVSLMYMYAYNYIVIRTCIAYVYNIISVSKNDFTVRFKRPFPSLSHPSLYRPAQYVLSHPLASFLSLPKIHIRDPGSAVTVRSLARPECILVYMEVKNNTFRHHHHHHHLRNL